MNLLANITKANQDVDYVSLSPITTTGTAIATPSPGQLSGESFSLSGSGEVSAVNESLNFNFDEPFSGAFWINNSDFSSFVEYVGRRETGNQRRGWVVTAGPATDRQRISFILSSRPGFTLSVTTVGSLESGKWNHVAFSYDGSGLASGVSLWVNGRAAPLEIGDEDIQGGFTQRDNVPFVIRGTAGGTLYDDVRIYSGQLSGGDVLGVYHRGAPTSNSNLISSSIDPFTNTNQPTFDWFGRATIVELNDGSHMRFTRTSTGHTSSLPTEVVANHSADGGDTWSSNNTRVDGAAISGMPLVAINGSQQPHDITSALAPNGDVIVIASYFSGARHGARLWRSTDNGLSFSDEGQISYAGVNPDGLNLGGGQIEVVGSTIYIAGWFDPTPGGAGETVRTVLLQSSDNGVNWTLVADVTDTTTDTNEPGVVALSPTRLLVVARDTQQETTYQRVVRTDGVVEPLEDIGEQVGVLQRPMLFRVQDKIVLIARLELGEAEQTVAYVRNVDGSWGPRIYVDSLTYDDAGYPGVIVKGDLVRIQNYAGTEQATTLLNTVLRVPSDDDLNISSFPSETATGTTDLTPVLTRLDTVDTQNSQISQGIADIASLQSGLATATGLTESQTAILAEITEAVNAVAAAGGGEGGVNIDTSALSAATTALNNALANLGSGGGGGSTIDTTALSAATVALNNAIANLGSGGGTVDATALTALNNAISNIPQYGDNQLVGGRPFTINRGA